MISRDGDTRVLSWNHIFILYVSSAISTHDPFVHRQMFSQLNPFSDSKHKIMIYNKDEIIWNNFYFEISLTWLFAVNNY